MSEIITIPSCRSPFTVDVNGEIYSYPAGETVEVPDEVAEIINRHIDMQPEAEPYIGAVRWNDIGDRPFGKEVDSTVYTASKFEQLSALQNNAEDYTHGAKLCVTTYMPGSVTLSIDGFIPAKSIPLVPINQYYALGKFEVNGRKFCIYSAYIGSGYELYVLGTTNDGLYGQTFRISNLAKINYLPTEYINMAELKSFLGL